jgi:mercuric ion transport protein
MHKPSDIGSLIVSNDRSESSSLNRAQKLAAAGGIIGALAASSCCILPVLLFSLGIGGAWIGSFTRLAPYQPYFIAGTLAFLGAGYWLVHRASKATCSPGDACAHPLPNRLVKIVLVTATIIVITAWGFDYVAPLILS